MTIVPVVLKIDVENGEEEQYGSGRVHFGKCLYEHIMIFRPVDIYGILVPYI